MGLVSYGKAPYPDNATRKGSPWREGVTLSTVLLALIMDSCAYCATYQLEQKDNQFLSSSLILIGFSLCVQYSLSDKPWYFLCQI